MSSTRKVDLVFPSPVQPVVGSRYTRGPRDGEVLCGRLLNSWLRKLDGPLRPQREVPRQPSEGCLLFASVWSSGTCVPAGPVWSSMSGSNIINNDVWPLRGPSVPTLWPAHYWIPFGSLLRIRLGIHFCSIFGCHFGADLERLKYPVK